VLGLLEQQDNPASYANLLRKAKILRSQGAYFNHKMGNLVKAKELYNESLAICRKIENNLEIAACLDSLGWITGIKENVSIGMKYIEQALSIKMQYGYAFGIGFSLLIQGSLYSRKGQLSVALMKLKEGLNRFNEISNDFYSAIIQGQIAVVFYLQGEYLPGIKHIEHALASYRTLLHTTQLSLRVVSMLSSMEASAFRIMGNLYHYQGKLKTALKSYEKALTLFEKNEDYWVHAACLFELICLLDDMDEIEWIKTYSKQLKSLVENLDNKGGVEAQNWVRISQAIILKANSRFRDQAKAQSLLLQVVDEPLHNMETTLIAILKLIELYLRELKFAGNETVLQDTLMLLSRLQEIATDQNAIHLSVYSQVFQAKLLLIQGKLETASDLLNLTAETAKNHNLGTIHTKVLQEQTQLFQDMAKWQELIASNASLHDRMAIAQLQDYLLEVKKVVHLRTDTG
jgi:tetratricopeptide (TPR) repeat protein